MDFANPKWLWALAVLPLVAFAIGTSARRRRDDLARFTGRALGESLAPGYSWRKNLLKGTLVTAALALIVFALAGPRFGTQLVKVEREGIDVVIALDTSLSMLAEDMLPNRLERARQEMVDLIKGLQGDRVGIVVFAGNAFAVCPLTVDYDAALMFTRSIDVYMVSEPGTALEKAIRSSVALFDESERSDRAIILVTDGENHEGDPLKAAAEAAAMNIRVYTIGIGNPAGELIPERGTDGAIAGYKRDKRGETVMTRLDENTLQAIASTSKGKYLPATREGFELAVLYDEIAGMERKKIKGEFVERRKDRFWIFLALALGLLGIDSLVSARATGLGRRRRPFLHTGVPAALLAVALLVPVAADAKGVDGKRVREGNERYNAGEYGEAMTLYRRALGDTLKLPKNFQGVFYNQGNTLYMQEKFSDAIEFYQKSYSEDSTLTGRMLYNRANALLRGGQLGEAIESYVQALHYLPDDEQARHNLEMALRMLEQQQQQQQQQDGDGENQNDRQQDQQERDQEREEGEQKEEEQGDEAEELEQPPPQEPDSAGAPPPQADSTAVPPVELSPEDMQALSLEDAMRILQALEEQEKQLQKARRRAAFRRLKKSGKDW